MQEWLFVIIRFTNDEVVNERDKVIIAIDKYLPQ
jgi:very-short-patch-repair endonuclease